MMTAQTNVQSHSTNNFSFWQKWLLVVSYFSLGFGVFMALFGTTPLFDLFNDQLNIIFWGTITPPGEVMAMHGFYYGLSGGVLAGWAITLISLTQHPFNNREKWAWNCIIGGVVAWYILDTMASIRFGVYFNVVANTLFLVTLLLPLLSTKKYF